MKKYLYECLYCGNRWLKQMFYDLDDINLECLKCKETKNIIRHKFENKNVFGYDDEPEVKLEDEEPPSWD